MENLYLDSSTVPRTYPRPQKRKMNHFRIRVISIATLLLIVIFTSFTTSFLYSKPSDTNITPIEPKNNTIDTSSWELMLVNATHPVDENFYPDLTTLANGNQVDIKIYPHLQEMFNAARDAGYYPEVTSGYRSTELQQMLYDNEIASYTAQGYGYEEAEQLAKGWVAFPGTSEHHTGLAVDISAAEYSGQSSEEMYPWFMENCYKYGFILRYPEDKTDITGINYEPWHYRYVGKKVAKEIHEQGICFEEYLENAR